MHGSLNLTQTIAIATLDTDWQHLLQEGGVNLVVGVGGVDFHFKNARVKTKFCSKTFKHLHPPFKNECFKFHYVIQLLSVRWKNFSHRKDELRFSSMKLSCSVEFRSVEIQRWLALHDQAQTLPARKTVFFSLWMDVVTKVSSKRDQDTNSVPRWKFRQKRVSVCDKESCPEKNTILLFNNFQLKVINYLLNFEHH